MCHSAGWACSQSLVQIHRLVWLRQHGAEAIRGMVGHDRAVRISAGNQNECLWIKCQELVHDDIATGAAGDRQIENHSIEGPARLLSTLKHGHGARPVGDRLAGAVHSLE